MMKELMELIKQKMITSVTSINKISSSDSDQCASQACLNLARTYEILYFLDKKETAEPIEVEAVIARAAKAHKEMCSSEYDYGFQNGLEHSLYLLKSMIENKEE